MRHFIITAIVILAAAKAKAQAKGHLTNKESNENLRKSKWSSIKGRAMHKNQIFTKGLDKNELF